MTRPSFPALLTSKTLISYTPAYLTNLLINRYGFLNSSSVGEKATQNGHVDNRKEAEIQRRREAKWLDMFANWDAFMMDEYSRIRGRCRKGIPSSVRARAWLYLCGAHRHLDKRSNTEFRRLYNQRGNQKYVDDIEKDLHRNFPTHEMFGGAYERIGQTELYRVLKAYSVLNPVDGYCQAMAPLAALLLMNMPSEQAFWCMVAICDRYIPGYYSPGMEAIQLDGDILFGLLKKVAPAVHKHLKKQGVEPVLFMTEWFLCVFARTLPWPSVMRVWDMFMCEGVKVLFRVGLVLLKYSLPKHVRKRCPSMYETLEVLKNLPEEVTEEHFLVEQVLRLRLSESDMERENRRQLKKRRALNAENQNGTRPQN